MQATVTARPRGQRRGTTQAQAAQVLPPIDHGGLTETTRLTFDEIENLLLRIHGRTDAIKACAGLSSASSGNLDMNREQLSALLDLFVEGIRTVAYEMQETVGDARRRLGMYRSAGARQF